jgi:hypothetical protein
MKMFTEIQKDIIVAINDIVYEGGLEAYEQKDIESSTRYCLIRFPHDDECGYDLCTRKIDGKWYVGIRRILDDKDEMIAYLLIDGVDNSDGLMSRRTAVITMLNKLSAFIDP